MRNRHLIRKAISVGICAIVMLDALGFGNVGSASAAAPSSKADQLIATGKKYLGVKYKFGAPTGVTSAFDCSSFTQYIFKKIGVSLPRSSSSQATKGVKVSKSELKKGDLVFFKTSGNSKINHVAVYAGNGKLLHASGTSVKISNLNSSYWKSHYATARRVL